MNDEEVSDMTSVILQEEFWVGAEGRVFSVSEMSVEDCSKVYDSLIERADAYVQGRISRTQPTP